MAHRMNDADLQPFRNLAAAQQRLAREAERSCELELDAIIQTRCRDPRHIEKVLDRMLGFCFDADVLLLFKRLCRYYFEIDPMATAEYIRIYRDMWDEDREPGDE